MTRSWLALPLLTLAASNAGGQDKGLEFTGRVEPSATVDLRARVDGRITAVHCKAGDVVKKGAVLFEIDPRPYEAELRRAEAGIGQAEARLRFYAIERDRARTLRQTGGVNQSELDRIEAERLNAESTLVSAKATVELARLNLEFTKVVAPMDGRVLNPLAAGNVVRADRYVLGTLVADDPVVVVFNVDEKTLLRLPKAAGMAGAVGFVDEDGFPHQGRVDAAGGPVDPKTGTAQWRLMLPNADRRVLPGMSARVRLAPGQQK